LGTIFVRKEKHRASEASYFANIAHDIYISELESTETRDILFNGQDQATLSVYSSRRNRTQDREPHLPKISKDIVSNLIHKRPMSSCMNIAKLLKADTGGYTRVSYKKTIRIRELANSDRKIEINHCQLDGFFALHSLDNISVFFYRRYSLGECGSGIRWLNNDLFNTVLDKLLDGGLIVTDGSNFDADRGYEELLRNKNKNLTQYIWLMLWFKLNHTK